MPRDPQLQESERRSIPLHWLQALRGKSVLLTREEALAIIGPHWADVVPEETP